MPWRTCILAVCLAALGCVGCATGDTRDLVALPEGDLEAGRQVFLSHGCALCHRATGEVAMPQPTSTTIGPELGHEQSGWSARRLVTAIVDPSHRRDQPVMAGDQPPDMMEYADELTVRELADLLAYLRYLGD